MIHIVFVEENELEVEAHDSISKCSTVHFPSLHSKPKSPVPSDQLKRVCYSKAYCLQELLEENALGSLTIIIYLT